MIAKERCRCIAIWHIIFNPLSILFFGSKLAAVLNEWSYSGAIGCIMGSSPHLGRAARYQLYILTDELMLKQVSTLSDRASIAREKVNLEIVKTKLKLKLKMKWVETKIWYCSQRIKNIVWKPNRKWDSSLFVHFNHGSWGRIAEEDSLKTTENPFLSFFFAHP